MILSIRIRTSRGGAQDTQNTQKHYMSDARQNPYNSDTLKIDNITTFVSVVAADVVASFVRVVVDIVVVVVVIAVLIVVRSCSRCCS